MNRAVRTLVLPAALATVLTASACGSGSSTPASPSHMSSGMSSDSHMGSGTPTTLGGSAATTAHNGADVQFATDMIPHHAQAVQMADMASTRAKSAEVKALAAQIKTAQGPEITSMSAWLKGWGKPVPSTMGGHDMGAMGGSSGGMMSDQEMGALGKTTGAGFDRMWLTMMTRHHQGAVTMARTELTHGRSAEAKTLAGSIITGQTKEIAQMRAILGSKGL